MKQRFSSVISVLAFFLACADVRACDEAAADGAYKAKEFTVSEQIASTGDSSVYCLQAQADAAFAAGNEQNAFRLYAQSWVDELNEAFRETKGSSKFWHAVGKGFGVLMMAGSLYAASEGAMPADQAADNMGKSQELIEKLDADFAQATGDPNHRKTVKAAIRDIDAVSKRKTSAINIVNPRWGNLPGSGMARVHVNGQLCNAIRKSKGVYLASNACIAKAGLVYDKFVSIESTLRPTEYAKVINSFQPEHPDGLIRLEVASGEKGDSEILDSDWRPINYLGNVHQMPDSGRYAAVWFAPELNYLVPVFQDCSDAEFEGCGDIYSESATLWVSECKSGCNWKFYGIAGPDGQIERPQ